MNINEFNTKYKAVLSEGHYGLDIDYPEVVAYLDKLFPELIKLLPNFKYQQIKTKFGGVRFYFTSDLPETVNSIISIGVETCVKNIITNILIKNKK